MSLQVLQSGVRFRASGILYVIQIFELRVVSLLKHFQNGFGLTCNQIDSGFYSSDHARKSSPTESYSRLAGVTIIVTSLLIINIVANY